MTATEGLGELGWLAIADCVRYLTHSQVGAAQHLGRAVHPYSRQVLAECRIANLGESSLELAS